MKGSKGKKEKEKEKVISTKRYAFLLTEDELTVMHSLLRDMEVNRTWLIRFPPKESMTPYDAEKANNSLLKKIRNKYKKD